MNDSIWNFDVLHKLIVEIWKHLHYFVLNNNGQEEKVKVVKTVLFTVGVMKCNAASHCHTPKSKENREGTWQSPLQETNDWLQHMPKVIKGTNISILNK